MTGELVVRDRRGARPAEVRDPRGATRILNWSSPELPMIEDWNADQAFRLGYLANVIAYKCVQLRSRTAASVPIVAGRKIGDLKTKNENSPLARLLGPPPGGPAPKLSARKLLRWTFGQKIVTGRRAWEIETPNGRPDEVPVAFWPLVAGQLRPFTSEGGTEWFRVFEYGPQRNERRPLTFRPDQVFYGWEPSGTDFRQAESELQAARFDLSLVTLCDRYGIGFLRNNAVPSAIITTTAFVSEKDRRAFRQNWNNEFAGADNVGRVAFNEVGDGDDPVASTIDVKTLGMSNRDARLVETRRDAMIEVAISLGVPWSKLDASGRTFANAEVEDRTYWEETILPDLLDLQDDINMQLAPRFGDDVVWFDLSQVRALRRRVEPVSQTATAPSLVQARLWTVDEARVDYGLEPLPDGSGDRLMTVEEILALRGGGPPPSDAAARGADEVLGEIRHGFERLASALEARAADHLTSDREIRVPMLDPIEPPTGNEEPPEDDDNEVEIRRARIWRTADATVTGIEARWTRAFRRLFDRQAEATISRLTGKRGRQALARAAETRATPDPTEIFDVAFWAAETEQLAADLLEQAAGAGLDRINAAFDVSFDVTAPFVRDFLEARSNQLAGGVTQTTYDAIVQALAAGAAEGEGIDALAERVRHVFTVATEARSTVIARTEVISAYNGGQVLAAAQLPEDVVAGQEWIATRDARTREAHLEADGQIVRVGSAFSVGGDSLAYPGDPAGRGGNTIQCRCTVAFLTPDEMPTARGRGPVEVRVAQALLALVPTGVPFDEARFARALEAVS